MARRNPRRCGDFVPVFGRQVRSRLVSRQGQHCFQLWRIFLYCGACSLGLLFGADLFFWSGIYPELRGMLRFTTAGEAGADGGFGGGYSGGYWPGSGEAANHLALIRESRSASEYFWYPHQGWWKPLAFRPSKIIEVPKGDELSAD